jgi:ribosome-associated protein
MLSHYPEPAGLGPKAVLKERPTIEKNTPANATPSSMTGRDLAIALARVAADTRCTNVVVLDVSHVSPVTDYFIIGTGSSPRQMRTVADDCAEAAGQHGYDKLSMAGQEGNSWICIDFVDAVLHIFSDEARQFYDLDNLWADARPVEWKPA